jgi:hypothetical protein
VTRIAGVLALSIVALGPSCGTAETHTRGGDAVLERYGIAVTPPAGWHARLTRATVEAQTSTGELVVRLFEYEPATEVGLEIRRTHPLGQPSPFRAAEFGTTELGGDNPKGQGFARRNFSLAGRYFDLFVESASAVPSEGDLVGLNKLIASLDVRSGDFYPGIIEPPRFASAEGWHASFHGGGEVRATDHAAVWASTVPYRNGPRDLPPRDTLETLPPDGILIWIGLARDNRFPPTGELRRRDPVLRVPLQVSATQGGAGWEGQVRDMSLYRLWGWIGEQYNVDVWVFYGRSEPSPEQRAAAQDALDRLQLPDWGSWELDGRGDVAG